MILNRQPDFKTYLAEIPDGKAGILQTLRIMGKVVKAWRSNPDIRNTAISIVANVPNKDYLGEVKALFEFVRDRIRYVGDVADTQVIQTPDVTISLKAGNCTQKAVLLATLLESINHKTLFKAIGYDPEIGWDHVYLETLVGRRWYPLDASEDRSFGWEPPSNYGVEPIIWHN